MAYGGDVSLPGLRGKRVLVLGGGQGIGEETARLLAHLGCDLAIADRDGDRAHQLARDLDHIVNVVPVEVDVLDDQRLIDAIGTSEATLGGLDCLVTIIGMASFSPLLKLDIDSWDLDHRRNVRYAFIGAREFANRLVGRGAPGSIVFTGSVDGARSAPAHAAYGAAKAGLESLMKSMAVEWAVHGIRVNAVAPGSIVTQRFPYSEAHEAELSARIPMRRRGTPREIAATIVFLLSDFASYVTGHCLVADGGVLAQYPFELPAHLRT